MNEILLKAILKLFAIQAAIHGALVSFLARAFLERYLRHHLATAVVLAIACLTLAGPANALMPPDVIYVPHGDQLNVYTSDYANGQLIAQGRATLVTKPFTGGQPVDEVRTSQTEYLVRTYAYNPDSLKGGAVGSWLMPAASIRGLTAQQIRDLYALPALPQDITNVKVPAGTVIWTGPAGAIAGWGDGGGQQMFLTTRISADDYIYQRALGSNALWYAPQLSNDARQAGAYFDHLPRVTPYSDLEYVYNMLDYLGPVPLGKAMDQISPQRFDALTQIGLRDSLLFSEELTRRGLVTSGDGDDGLSQRVDGVNLWARLLGGTGRQEANYDKRFGWRYKDYGLVMGADVQPSPGFMIGMAFGLITGDFSWQDGLGDGRYTDPRLGLYLSNYNKDWFLEGSLTGGEHQESVNRHIIFDGVDRVPQSCPTGYDGALRLAGGLNYKLGGWDLQPLLTGDLLYQHFSSLDETQAGSLDLHVEGWDAWSLRGEAGLRLSHSYQYQNGVMVRPEFKLAVATLQPLDSRSLTANLIGQPGSFSAQGDTRTLEGLVPSLGVTLRTPSGVHIYGFYEAEVRDDFIGQSLSAGLQVPF